MSFDFSTPYASSRLPVFARNIVSTSHPLAAQAGLRIMQQGGNAVDAAIAAAATMTIVECLGPSATSLDTRVLPSKIWQRFSQSAQTRLGLGHGARRCQRLGNHE